MLELRHVGKVFYGTTESDTKVALNDINLKIEDGEFVTVIGENGSGKTTFANVIAGTHKQTEGNVILDDVDLSFLPEHKRSKFISRVFQDPKLGTAGNMSILENMEIAMQRAGKRTLRWGFKSEHVALFQQNLARLDLGLEKRMTQKIGYLSGGQRQSVTLLMATLKKPKLLLLDEHTASLDPKTAKKILALTDEIVKEGKITTIMITHNLKDAIKYGNRIIMFKEGKIVLDLAGSAKKDLTVDDLMKLFTINEEE